MNIYDIAKKTGFSITTVSRVINNKGYVSEKTRKKIEKVMAENEYQPNAIARGLASGSMKTIAIFSVDVRVPHYALTSFIMERMLTDLGYLVYICNTGENIADWKRYLQIVSERKVDGIILTGSIYNQLENEEIMDRFDNIPIVMANGKMQRRNVKSVFVDEGRGIELAVEHLFAQGHIKLAYVKDKQTESANRKRDGFVKEMALMGAADAARHVYEIEYGLEAGAEIGKKLFELGYNGIVFGEDLTAVGAVNALQKKGIDIPSEIAITGCNNSEYAQICNPGLTSINNKADVLSEYSVHLLTDLLSGKNPAEIAVIPELVVRESSFGGSRGDRVP